MNNSQKITVLHCIGTSDAGGAQRVLLQIVSNMDKRRYEPKVVLLRDGWLLHKLEAEGIETSIIKLNRTYDPKFVYDLALFIKEHRVDIVHSHLFVMNFYGCLAARLAKVPIVAIMHGRMYNFDKPHRRLAWRQIGWLSDRIVAVSKELRSTLIETVNINPNKVQVIHNAVDLEKYSNTTKQRLSKADLGIDNLVPVVGTVAVLRPEKGIEYLLQAVPRILQMKPDARFVIVGDGACREELIDEVKRLRISESVDFLGHRDDVAGLLACMDVFVLPSISEGIPISVLEAMSMAKPVVATEVGGTPEVVINGKTGLLVPPRSSDSLAEAILCMLDDPDFRAEMSRAGRQRVEAKFGLTAMINQYQRLYRNLINHDDQDICLIRLAP